MRLLCNNGGSLRADRRMSGAELNDAASPLSLALRFVETDMSAAPDDQIAIVK